MMKTLKQSFTAIVLSAFTTFTTPAFAGNPSMCGEPLGHCSGADVAPIGGDGFVGVDDLLAVINTWAQNGNPSGIRPQGDVAPWPFGDCIVDVDDLIVVISLWGQCSPGSCCLPSGECAGPMFFGDCAAAGGSFAEQDSCFANPQCPQVQANDDCANAFESAGPIEYIWYNNFATTDGPSGPSGGCEEQIVRDLWYRHTVTCPGLTKFLIYGTVGVSRIIAVYDGWSCPPTQLLACEGSIHQPEIVLDLKPGQQVTIRVGSIAGKPSYEYENFLVITCQP